MTVSQSEVDAIIAELDKKFGQAHASGKVEEVASFYETHAVLISSGKETKVWYGREDIKKFLIDMMAHSDPNTKTRIESTAGTADGDYLVHRGSFTMGPDVWVPYELVWKKQDNGSYLIVRDEFKSPF